MCAHMSAYVRVYVHLSLHTFLCDIVWIYIQNEAISTPRKSVKMKLKTSFVQKINKTLQCEVNRFLAKILHRISLY